MLKNKRFKKYRFLFKIKLCQPIEIEWSLNFRALTPTPYVKNKMADYLKERENSFSAIVFLLIFNFRT